MKAKYEQGQEFETIVELVAWLQSGRHVYLHGKIWNNKWATNLQLGYLMEQIEKKTITRAKRR